MVWEDGGGNSASYPIIRRQSLSANDLSLLGSAALNDVAWPFALDKDPERESHFQDGIAV